MKSKDYKYISGHHTFGKRRLALRSALWLIACVVISGLFPSCVDEKLIDEGAGGEGIAGEYDGGAITIYIDAGNSFETRSSVEQTDAEAGESYIRKFRVKFFEASTGKDYFLFDSPIISSFENVTDAGGNELIKTTIQLGNLTDDQGNSIAKKVRDQLRDYPFKIALIVNMPNEGRSGFDEKDNTKEWGYQESYFNKNETNESTIKTIHDIHFMRKDNGYQGKYNFLGKSKTAKEGTGWYTSDYVNWVTERSTIDTEDEKVYHGKKIPQKDTINSESKAENWLRSYWDPKVDYEYMNDKTGAKHPVYRLYSNLWKLWNFGGGFDDNSNVVTYSAIGARDWATEWKNRNGDEFNSSEGGWLGPDGNTWITNEVSLDGLTVVPTGSNNQNNIIRSLNRNNFHGLILPPVVDIATNPNATGDYKKYITETAKGYLTFKQSTSGHLKIYFGAYGGSERNEGTDPSSVNAAQIRVMRGQNLVETFTSSKFPKTNGTFSDDVTYEKAEIKITGDEEDIYIFTDDNSKNSAVIYAVEFISDIYLNDTNREGVKPGESNTIPMYGVEKYEKFGFWGNEETKDLMAISNKPISLIRSVAKVEVYLPERAAQIYMRCMNRGANIEPVDVSTPTSQTWKQQHTQSEGCEWFYLNNHNPWFGSNNSDYMGWLKWYYGTWKERENWTDIYNDPNNPNFYPHIFNARIGRSDYCEFIYAGEENGYHKYVLYVPEKGVDDPNDPDNPGSTPKVMHIEYRYDKRANNLDDNKCYRIYFTNYSTNSNINNVSKNGYDAYEANYDNLKNHWPILRNHIYRFMVRQSSGGTQQEVINLRVNPWDYQPSEDWEEVW